MQANMEHVLRKSDESASTKHEFIIQGAKIVAYERGEGVPVLFLHGAPDTHDMWLPLMDQITGQITDQAGNGFRLIAPDLPGFGESTLPGHFSLSLDNMADFVREFVRMVGINEPVALVTTDFGGHYGMAFAAKYPNMVRGIAISNTNFFSDYEWHFFAKLYRVPVLGDLLLSSASRSMMRKTLKSTAPALPDSYIDSSYDTGFGSAKVRRTMLRMYRERASSDFRGWEDKLLQVLATKPALILWGDKDPFITPAYAERYKGAKVHHFTEYSHWVPLEAPGEYAKVLLPWLRGL
jgi:pimeloyl-ACP methyl ester carboxylesterase